MNMKVDVHQTPTHQANPADQARAKVESELADKAKPDIAAIPSKDGNFKILNQTTAQGTLRDGRVVTIRKLSPMYRMRLLRIIGPESSKNELYLNSAVPAFVVSEINGSPEPPAQNVTAIEERADRLGDLACIEIAAALEKCFPDEALNAFVTEMQEKSAVKNS